MRQPAKSVRAQQPDTEKSQHRRGELQHQGRAERVRARDIKVHDIGDSWLNRGANLVKEFPWQRPAGSRFNLGMGELKNLVVRVRMCPALTEKGSADMQDKAQQNNTCDQRSPLERYIRFHHSTKPDLRISQSLGSRALITRPIELSAKNTTSKVDSFEEKLMLTGIVLLLAGISIALYPPLRFIIVASILIALGLLPVVSAWYHRKLQRRGGNPIIELILRY